MVTPGIDPTGSVPVVVTVVTMQTNTTVCLGSSRTPGCDRFMTKIRKSQRVTASFRVDKALLEEMSIFVRDQAMSIFVRDQAGAPLYLSGAWHLH